VASPLGAAGQSLLQRLQHLSDLGTHRAASLTFFPHTSLWHFTFPSAYFPWAATILAEGLGWALTGMGQPWLLLRERRPQLPTPPHGHPTHLNR